MAQANRDRLKTAALLALGLMLLFTVGLYAEDPPFSGKWRGESRVTAAGSAPGGAPGGSPGAGPAATTPPGAPGGGATAGGGAPGGGATAGGGAPGGGAPRGGGGAAGGGARGGRGGFGGGGFGGPQKVSLNLKQSKDNKLSGNITFGEGESLDVKEGKVDGNTITFKAGRPQPTEYSGELKGSELILIPSGGRGSSTQYVLTKK